MRSWYAPPGMVHGDGAGAAAGEPQPPALACPGPGTTTRDRFQKKRVEDDFRSGRRRDRGHP